MVQQQSGQGRGFRGVCLVEHEELRQIRCRRVREDLAHSGDLPTGVRMRTVHDVQDQIRSRRLFECRAEGLDELVREVPHEADGVGERVHAALVRLRPADSGVEGGEELVLHHHSCVREAVEQ